MSKGNAKNKGSNPNNDGGTAVSIANTPQAKDDHFVLDLSQPSLTFDLLGNDSGGKAKSLWSIDKGSSYQNLMGGDDDAVVESSTNGASISINADDTVNYDTSSLDASFLDTLSSLTEGQSIEDSFVYAIRLGNGTLSWATATVEFEGMNDDPTLAAATEAAQEDGAAILVDLSLLGNDVDSDDDGTTLTYSISGSPTEGDATINGSSLSFDPGSDFQDLAEGETRDVVIQVTATDSHGASATNDVTVTVTGSNDAPTLSAMAASAEEDGAAISVDLAALADDLDSDDDANSLSYAITGAPSEGSAAISGTSLSFDPEADFQDLAEGETREVVINVTATDAHGATASNDVTVTVTGSNDAPTLSGITANAVEDGNALSFNLAALADDLDSDDDANSLSYAITGVPTEGAATINGTTLSFDPGNDFQDLAEGETREAVINVTATDAHGESASSDFTVTVTGTNDAPIITGGDVSAELLTEPASSGVVLLEASGVLNFEDIDLTDIHSVSALSGTAADDNVSSGSLAVQIASSTDSNGENGQINWTYSVDNSDVSWISAGDDSENNKQTFVVRLEDQNGGFHEQTVQLFLGGGVAAPVVSPLSTSVSEADVDGQINSVLFIDDSGNRSQNWKNAWFGALSQNGYTYDQETMLSYNGNPSSNLNDYDLVIWSVSDRAYTNLTPTNINTMINYLDQGGRLLYAGGHSVYSEPYLNHGGFASQYLGITDYQNNMPTISNTNAGWHIASGPDGNYTLSPEPGAYYGGTMTSAFGTYGTAVSLMQLDNWTVRANNDIVVVNDTGDFVSSTWGFDMAQLDATYRTDFLGYTLDEMGGKAFEFDLLSGASDPNGGTLSVSNLTQLNGPAVSANVDAEGILSFTSGSLDFLDEGETVDLTYEYDVSNADASTSNTVTITVTGVADDTGL